MRIRWFVVLASVLLGVGLAPVPARAHESGASTLHLEIRGAEVAGDWELTARDARALLGLPLARVPDALAPAEEQALAELFVERVRVEADGHACVWRIESGPSPARSEPPTEVTSVVAGCEGPMSRVRLVYPMLFDLDPRHRGFFSLRDARHTQAGVFHVEQQEIELPVEHPDAWRTLREYASEGARHVWEGPDHLLFLLSLLLAAVSGGVRRREERADWRRIGTEIVSVVTAFTLAHSITLALAVLSTIRLPVRWVEVAIAITVFAVAWNNLRPWLRVRAAWLAFGFGLIHGFGFAGALVRLGLPADARTTALVGFNAGVELGQLALVALWLPLALPLRDKALYRRGIVPGVSFAIAWIAVVWILERALGLELLPWI